VIFDRKTVSDLTQLKSHEPSRNDPATRSKCADTAQAADVSSGSTPGAGIGDNPPLSAGDDGRSPPVLKGA
jgi:hypothetical protein